jgi:hypothetical protein
VDGRGGKPKRARRNESPRTKSRKTHLDDLVPSSRDDDGVQGVGREANARDPLGVALLLDVELALSESVPELDGAVTRSRNDLPVVGREGDGEDVRGVSNETAGGESGVEVPKTEGLVPRGGKSELSVGGDDDIRDEAVVSVEDALGVAVGRLRAGEGQLPKIDVLV